MVFPGQRFGFTHQVQSRYRPQAALQKVSAGRLREAVEAGAAGETGAAGNDWEKLGQLGEAVEIGGGC